MKEKDKKSLVEFLISLRDALEEQIPLINAIEVIKEGIVNEKIKEDVDVILNILREGGSFSEAAISVGWDKYAFKIAEGFEREGNLVQGLNSAIRVLTVSLKIDEILKTIDKELYQIISLAFIIGIIMVYFYFPKIASVLGTMPLPEEVKEGWFYRTIMFFRNFNFSKDYYYAVVVGILLFFVLKFKLHRKLLVLIPSYKAIEVNNDRIVLLSSLENSNVYIDTVKNLAEIFKEKYKLDEIGRLFTELSFKAFERTDLFPEREKKLLIMAGENNLKNIFSFLRKGAEKEREELFERIKLFMEYLKLFVIISILLVAGGVPIMVVSTMLKGM